MRYVLVVSALVLAGCNLGPEPGMDRRINQVDLNNDSRNLLRGYFDRENPKAFAFSPETRGHGLVWDAASTADAESGAIADCEQRTGTACELFASDDKIVWVAPEITYAGEIGLRFRATTDVNLRAGPGTGSEVLAVLSPDERVDVTGVDGNWYAVQRDDGTAGYVFGDYLREDYGQSGK